MAAADAGRVSSLGVTHYLNADFDLTLRPRARQVAIPELVRQVRALTVQGLVGAAADDAVLVRAAIPDAFLEHWEDSGLTLPRLIGADELGGAPPLRPFGWSAEAAALNAEHPAPTAHPELDVVRKVNGRRFAWELEAEIGERPEPSRLVSSIAELEAFLAAGGADSSWVVKSEFGHAALASRRVGSSLSPVDRRFVEARLAEDDHLLVEPWFDRERDWSVVFDVPFSAATLRIHETVYTRDGAPIGAWFSDAPEGLAPHRERLGLAAEAIAGRLEQAGYFGPVCVDAFSWPGGLRVLADLNARCAMSDGAYRLWRQFAPDAELFQRFFNRLKLRLPDELPDLFDRATRRGILFASPRVVELDGESVSPAKMTVIIVADHREQVLELEREFRERFER